MKSVSNQLYFKSLKRIRELKCNQRNREDRKGDQVTYAQEQVEMGKYQSFRDQGGRET